MHVEMRDHCGTTALMKASEYGYAELVEFLIERGAIVTNRNYYSRYPIHYAASGGHVGIMQMLLSHGAKMDVRDQSDSTPLHLSAGFGEIEACRFLIKCGAFLYPVDNNDKLPIDRAGDNKHYDVVCLLRDSSNENVKVLTF